jgi:hypothetical protein
MRPCCPASQIIIAKIIFLFFELDLAVEMAHK